MHIDDLKREYTELERNLVELQNDFDSQRALFNRALKILFGALETDLPYSISEGSWSEPADIAEARTILTQLERGYRIYTMERERLSESIVHAITDWVVDNRPYCSEQKQAELDSLLSELKPSEAPLADLAAMLKRILEYAKVDNEPDQQSSDPGAKPAVDSPANTGLIIAIKRIVDLIPLEQQERKLAAELTLALNEQLHPAELVQRLQSIVNLLEERQGSQVEQVSEFLTSMVSRLAELQQTLQESLGESQMLDQKEGEQADRLSQDIDEMRSGLATASNLEELKIRIARQLDGLTAGFSEFKASREARIRLIQHQHQELQLRFLSVESDANSAHDQIDVERKRALTDHLTGLPNRRAYEDHLRAELNRFKRYQTPFSVLVIDIDHFKSFNDSMGHLIGDRALKLVAKVLRKLLRESDFIARYGGEEFVVLLTEVGREGALKTAEKLRYAVERAPFKYEGKLVPIRVSIGVTEVRTNDSSMQLFHRADKALYEAKESGRNKVSFI